MESECPSRVRSNFRFLISLSACSPSLATDPLGIYPIYHAAEYDRFVKERKPQMVVSCNAD